MSDDSWLRDRKWFDKNKHNLLKVLPQFCANCHEIGFLEVHHIVPLSLGGTNRATNLVVLCHRCHDSAHMWDRKEQRRQAQLAGIRKAQAEGRMGAPKRIASLEVAEWRSRTGASISETARHFSISTASVKRSCAEFNKANRV